MEPRRVLNGKITVLTGAASGIGEAIAMRFAREGARLMLVDIQRDKGEQLQEHIRAGGAEVEFMPADLADEAQVAQIVPATLRRFHGLDIVINNAGLFGWLNKKSAGDTPQETWERTLNINLTAAFLISRAALPHMVERKQGVFVNIASIGGLEAFPEFAAYCVSKAGLISLTKSLAIDYGKYNIRANAICPGAIDTPGNDVFVQDREKYLQIIASVTPLQKPGAPPDIAAAAAFLASDEARYITGAALVVDGGRTIVA
jgi:NAD(P)-dependent dehydrogenase (short-subunit alcohol dehydrogenase family)